MENTYCVYKLTSPDGRCYIGFTKHGFNPNKRWEKGAKYAECPRIHAAIEMYGWDTFTKEILDCFMTKEEACASEKYWVSYFNSTDPNFGYNMESGGVSGYTHSEETKKKVSQSHMGMRVSEEAKEKIRQKALARPPASEETRSKMRAAALGHPISEKARRARTGKRCYEASAETRQKLSEIAKVTRNRRKRVMCIETGEIFDSAREASLHYGKAKGSLTSTLYAGCTFCGMHWKYLDDMGECRMSISDKNVRTNVVIPKELKAKLEELAKAENRSLNNYIFNILQNHVDSL